MRTQIYDHRSGLKVVPNDIVADVKNIIWNINPALSKKTVSSLKESVRERLEKEGVDRRVSLRRNFKNHDFIVFKRRWIVFSDR